MAEEYGPLTRDNAYEYLVVDLRWAAKTFFENMFMIAGLDIDGPDESRYINGLADIAQKECADVIASIIEDAQRAEEQAYEQFSVYSGLDPSVLGGVESEDEDDSSEAAE